MGANIPDRPGTVSTGMRFNVKKEDRGDQGRKRLSDCFFLMPGPWYDTSDPVLYLISLRAAAPDSPRRRGARGGKPL